MGSRHRSNDRRAPLRQPRLHQDPRPPWALSGEGSLADSRGRRASRRASRRRRTRLEHHGRVPSGNDVGCGALFAAVSEAAVLAVIWDATLPMG